MRFKRGESPPPQKRYQDYKPYLRKDFRARCAYCLIHEAHFGGLRNYHVDHFRPRTLFPKLLLTYTNLYYACSLCNTFKGETWPSRTQLRAGFAFGDPCKEDVYRKHFRIDERDGSLHARSKVGLYTSEHLRLNRRQLQRYRRMQLETRRACDELRSALRMPGLPSSWVARVKRALNKIERDFLDPQPPYETFDLLP